MTHEQLVRRLVKRTGFPEKYVRQFLQAQTDVLRSALIHGEEVYFRTLLRIVPSVTGMSVQSPGKGRKRVERILLRTRPTRAFREELNLWTRGDEMPIDKFAVVVDPAHDKLGSAKGHCPSCGGTEVSTRGGMPYCAACGFEPWEPKEKHGRQEEGS